ncbi:MAG TPA: hypothetical protein VH280_14780 [Verrucomicrobiae bacterium]|jgi:hypothetical protein|nr:hypothetical protein [Verrucomicrobiae bacterium]
MNDVAREYLGQDRDQDFAPINARDRVIEDNDIDLGARLMFVRILDLSTRDGVRDHYGAVTISQQKLADKFGVSLRTIWNWKQQLVAKGVVWMGHKYMPNAWPMDTYHVTELDPPGKTEGRTTGEGMWGNGKRRQAPDRIGLGAREPGQTIIPGTGARGNRLHSETGFQTAEKSSFLPTIAAPDRNPLPAPAATHFHSEPQPIAAGSRNPLPLGAETGCDSEPKQVATESRNPLPLPAETGCEHKKSKSVVNSISRVGEEALPTEKQFQDWLKSLEGAYRSELRRLETTYVKKLALAKSTEAKTEWKRRLTIVQDRLLGGPVEDKPATSPKPVRAERKPTMSFEAQKKAWEKAKADSRLRKQEAATKVAART